MPLDENQHAIASSVQACLRQHWKTLVVTDILFKIVAASLLFPLMGIVLRFLIANAGDAFLSDTDIAKFLLGPMGWLGMVLILSSWLAIVALEQAALMGVVASAEKGQPMTELGGLKFAAHHAPRILAVTARMVGWALLSIAPALAIAGGVYLSMLSEFDINYYLKEKPPEFLAAVGIGVVLGLATGAWLLRLVLNWFFALPLVLFEDVPPGDALRESQQRMEGHRKRVAIWVVLWFLTVTLASWLITGAMSLILSWLLPGEPETLRQVTLTVGGHLLVASLLGLVVNLLATISFATVQVKIFDRWGVSDQTNYPEGAEAEGLGQWLRLTRTKLAIALIIGLLAAIAVGFLALRSIELEDQVAVMAHRGASHAAPENTLAAIEQAIADGADWVEIDVQETADDVVVVFHDSDFMKLAGNPLKIWDARMEDLAQIDIGSWFDPSFSDQRVPTLEQVLKTCKGRIKINIELKYYGHDRQLEQRVAELVEQHEMQSSVMLMSLKREGVKKMKTLRPEWKVGLLMSVSAGRLETIEADFLAVNAGFASQRLIDRAHAADKQVFVWTVNDATSMSSMISRGVDGLLTDRPALAKSVLQQRAEMAPPERLLLELAGWLGQSTEFPEQ